MPEPPDEEHAVLLDGDSQSSFDRPRTDSYGSTIFNLVTPDLPLYDEPLKVKAALYASHFLSAWGIRMWEFAIGLILLELYPSSLALVSAFGLVDGAAQIFSGPLIGDYVDRYHVLSVPECPGSGLRVKLVMQRNMLCFSTCSLFGDKHRHKYFLQPDAGAKDSKWHAACTCCKMEQWPFLP